MKRLWLMALPALMFGAIEGTVTNKTTGKPQAGVTVSILSMGGGGVQPGTSAQTGADGRFKIESAGGAHLLQAVYQGVTYNASLSSPEASAPVAIDVYDVTASGSGVTVEQHMVLLETDGKENTINETYIFRNPASLTWSDPKRGTLRFWMPEAGKATLSVRATAPAGMPVERPAKAAGEKGVYFLDFAVKPGETRFDLTYKLPAAEPNVVSGRALNAGDAIRLVVPAGISASGEGLKLVGQEPSTQASVYDVAGKAYTVTLTGAGSLRSTEPAERDEEDGPRIEEIVPRIYDAQYAILGLAFAILAIGFYGAYRRGQAAPAPAEPEAERKGKRKA